MSKSTPATRFALEAGVPFTVANYDYDPNAERVGLQAAEAMGVQACEVFKTLMVEIDGKPACAIVPSDREVDMKKLAAALGGKSARMMKPADAERLTGYKVGGISPLGQRKAVPVVLDELAVLYDGIFINGGQRGLQIRIAPDDLARILNCEATDIVR
ncbi:Cys-tRNA(Pro) deacylase [Pseudochelatococcus contaminans]|uniref:Cys-tRNA(Pro)/Cys-tRNA(Cys) deacylase n=1 Tax=Pseudochelatococcus contaminans TaxID=1538103 RepID=A0A7W5Z3A7_9HYPH|nr:Cys-tRNA(Pro) deacylase [Pseudochelatococcus contaminans]MBB3809204.1 Cys-tRNA(Pro)/Cys-tRNA(Cys) deacylase [Pseudochelatococcus contaminans]